MWTAKWDIIAYERTLMVSIRERLGGGASGAKQKMGYKLSRGGSDGFFSTRRSRHFLHYLATLGGTVDILPLL